MPHAHAIPRFALIALVALAGACERGAGATKPDRADITTIAPPSADVLSAAEWSTPLNLGAPINSVAGETNPDLTPDGLTLYFTSNRVGGLGDRDIYVSHRASPYSPWQTPANLGPNVNSASADIAPSISADGHLLFFASNRAGGQGMLDIWVSHRDDADDDLGWEAAVNLGPGVNTPDAETAPTFQQNAETGRLNLYFSRGAQVQPSGRSDIYVAAISRAGEVLGAPGLVEGLSVPNYNDAATTLRADAREIFFFSDRPGSVGFDLWTATRTSVHDRWSAPVRVPEPVNGPGNEGSPTLSSNGRTLIFLSDRPGGLGGADLWMATRTPRHTP